MKTQIWNGVGYHPLPEAFVEPTPPTLEQLKAAKVRALNDAFNARLLSGHVVEGATYALTKEGRYGYLERGLLYLYAEKRGNDNVGAKDKNENIVGMTYTRFKSRMVQVGAKYETLVGELAARKQAALDAEDETDLNAISEVFA